MIKIVGVGREGDVLVFEVEFDFKDEIHRVTIKKTTDEMLSFADKDEFLDYVRKVVADKRAELLVDLADEYVPLNEDIEKTEEETTA